jgi:hypothetical protein
MVDAVQAISLSCPTSSICTAQCYHTFMHLIILLCIMLEAVVVPQKFRLNTFFSFISYSFSVLPLQ